MQRDGGPGGPGGPGGAGNPVGGSFTGPAQALEIIGDHCFCYPGEFTATTATTTRMQFTTGNFYTVGVMRLAGYTDMGSPSSGTTASARVKLNGTTVICMKTDGAEEDQPFSDTADLIIPPYTEVQVTSDSVSTSVDADGSLSFTGRIYRG